MKTSIDEEATLGRFRQWLAEVRDEAEMLPEEPDAAAGRSALGQVGLVQLVAEFTALRHEVKLQTKSARGAGEATEQAIAAMQQAIELFRGLEPREADAAREAAQPLVEQLVELDEALVRGRSAIDSAHRAIIDDLAGRVRAELDGVLRELPSWKRWLVGPWSRKASELLAQRAAEDYAGIFGSLAEGYGLILSRMQRAMTRAELYRIECVGRIADPSLMTVVEVVDDPLRPPGLVIEEVRPGYYWKGKVFRFAEVRAVQSRSR